MSRVAVVRAALAGARAWTRERARGRGPGARGRRSGATTRAVEGSSVGSGSSDESSDGSTASTASLDASRMRRALEIARFGGARGEVPIGAVIVENDTGRVVAACANACERDGDPTAHAELRAIRMGAETLGNWRHLRKTTMYVTLEPCAMCAGGILQARVGRVVYGAKNALLGADGSWVSVLRKSDAVDESAATTTRPHAFSPDLDVTGGVLAEETGALMKEFFRARRERPMGDAGRFEEKG